MSRNDNDTGTEGESDDASGNVPPHEEWVAKELKRQYRRRLSDKNAAKAQNNHEMNDPPDDPNINDRTGKVLGFDLKHRATQEVLHIDVLTHTGYVTTAKIAWPDDPTDESEPLVRLCRWLDVPLTDLTQLKGAYVPLRRWGGKRPKPGEDAGKKLVIDLPPVDALGNRLKFRIHRVRQTHRFLNYALPGLMVSVVVFGWVPIFATVGLFPDLTAAPIRFFISILGMLSFTCMVAAVLGGLGFLSSWVYQRLFPSPE